MIRSGSSATACCLLLVILLAGCATLSREQCHRGDWYSLGVEDGAKGKPQGQLDRHMSACAEYGVAINPEQYLDGRRQGLNQYCQPENAFAAGLRGEGYQHVCPPAIDALFARYHAAAYEVHQLREELNQVENDLSYQEGRFYGRDLSEEDRHRIRRAIRELDRQRFRVRDELYSSERFLDLLMDESRRRSTTPSF